jgi:hypothetical protein
MSSEEETKINSEASGLSPNSSDAPNATTHSENETEQCDLKIFLASLSSGLILTINVS